MDSNTTITLLFTEHAKQKMAMLGVTREQIKAAILRGAKVQQTEGYLASYTYLKVAYKKIGPKTYKIKTVFIQP
ncbi:MAG TPA: DUF4258 domain-containing protein [Candidatus Nanoarchaeia archaeon]|nr:DUF4258 domain-containing protein [Candidatus Nanoarchaeia archaeon]